MYQGRIPQRRTEGFVLDLSIACGLICKDILEAIGPFRQQAGLNAPCGLTTRPEVGRLLLSTSMGAWRLNSTTFVRKGRGNRFNLWTREFLAGGDAPYPRISSTEPKQSAKGCNAIDHKRKKRQGVRPECLIHLGFLVSRPGPEQVTLAPIDDAFSRVYCVANSSTVKTRAVFGGMRPPPAPALP